MTALVPVDDTGRCFWCRVWRCQWCPGDACSHDHVRLPDRPMDVPDPEPETTGGQR